MSSGANYFLKKTMGDDFFESLVKFDLWKPGTRTVIDHEEIKTALMIVPRVLMAMLIRELAAMEIGETKEIHLPVAVVPAMLRVTKHERDVYSGEIEQENKKVVDFKYRSIPGVGLVIMSAFELYDTSKLLEENEHTGEKHEDNSQKLQDMIDKRLALHDMVARVVDKRLEEREAVNKLFLSRLADELQKEKKVAQQIDDVTKIAKDPGNAHADEYMRGMANGLEVANSIANDKEPQFVEPIKKGSPLKGFLEKKEKKAPKAEFSIEMVKGETVRCPDCGNALISGEVFTGCICLGDDMERKVYIKKAEGGITVRFGRGWDKENIEMLLEVLRSKRGQ